nr:reverse transcriptase domain-containing protein [Tanacetum cinerariifolium]
KKHDESWRMCVDFTDLNRACLQDCYPLPEIDWKVKSLCGYPFKCFLDAYKGYHQIQLAEADEEKTAFHTGQRVYCYTKMPFGLKNAGATYQRLMDKAFESQVGRNIEVYVNDLVVKSHTEAEMVRVVEETFRTLRKINMKLNLKICSFGLAEGVFLGFLSKSAEKSLPLFQTLKKCIKKSDFHWTAEAEQAFQQLKHHLLDLPFLVAPNPQEELIMYLSATYEAVSAVLMKERGTTQTPIYFISRALQGPELNYSPMEKLVLPRTSVKGKILADFLTEMPGDVPQAASAAVAQEEPWTLFTDGSSCVDGSGAGLILTNPEGVNVDSKLVANQVLGTYVAKEDNMIKYLEIVKGLVIEFTTFSISQVPRSKNKQADALSKIVSTSFAHLSKQVLVEVLENKSIKGKEVAVVIKEDGPTWVTQIADYLKEGVLPGDNKEARKLHLKARQYELREGVLYRPLSEGAGEGQVPDSRNGLLYEVGRSQGGGNDYWWADNGKQFADNPFKDWCDKLNITQRFAYPQSNGLVERANRSLREGIKARLGEEIGMPIYRTAAVDVVNNDKELRLNLDLLEERRERAAICKARAKSKMMKYYNDRVCGVAFKPGDFVYRSNDASHAVAGGKLGPNWEGPYEVTEALGNEAYKLRSTDGTVLPTTWNVTNLKRCYL